MSQTMPATNRMASTTPIPTETGVQGSATRIAEKNNIRGTIPANEEGTAVWGSDAG